jgi:putative GTP pyrophosphokinase
LDLKLNDNRGSLPEYSKFASLQFELQVRTIIQDAWSVLDHKIKYKKKIPIGLKRGINRLAALFEVADEEFLRIKNETQQEVQKVESNIEPNKEPAPELLNVFAFLSIAKGYFPNYQFDESKADSFVEEILKHKRDYGTVDLFSAFEKNGTLTILVEAHAVGSMSGMKPTHIQRVILIPI